MVNLSLKLKLVLDPSKSSANKINDEVAKTKQISVPIFSMFADAFEKKAKIYKVNKIKKQTREIPKFIFL